VNLTVQYFPETSPIINLDQTINYQNLFEIIEKRMMVATELLETLVTKIVDDIEMAFPFIKQVEISITKNPPINGFNGNVAVSLKKNIEGIMKKTFLYNCFTNNSSHFCSGNICAA